MAAWAATGAKLIELAAEDEAKGRALSASNKLERASLYLITAERMQGHGAPGREETCATARAAFDRSTVLGRLNRERVEIPLGRGTMPALHGDGRNGTMTRGNRYAGSATCAVPPWRSRR